MTPEEIKNHPVFKSLTEQQQAFVLALIETDNDRVKAAHKAWTCTSDDSARTMASRAMKNPNIAWLVESYFNFDPQSVAFTREAALEHAAKKARTVQDDKVALSYFDRILEMNGWLKKPADNEEGKTENPFWDEVARLEAEKQ